MRWSGWYSASCFWTTAEYRPVLHPHRPGPCKRCIWQLSMESTLPTLPEAIETAIRGSTFPFKLVLLIFTIAAMCVIAVMALTIIMSVYGRFFKIYVTGALSPLALSTFAGEPTAHMGAHYLKAFAGACLEGVVIAIACCLYGAFVQVIPPIQVAEDMGVFCGTERLYPDGGPAYDDSFGTHQIGRLAHAEISRIVGR